MAAEAYHRCIAASASGMTFYLTEVTFWNGLHAIDEGIPWLSDDGDPVPPASIHAEVVHWDGALAVTMSFDGAARVLAALARAIGTEEDVVARVFCVDTLMRDGPLNETVDQAFARVCLRFSHFELSPPLTWVEIERGLYDDSTHFTPFMRNVRACAAAEPKPDAIMNELCFNCTCGRYVSTRGALAMHSMSCGIQIERFDYYKL